MAGVSSAAAWTEQHIFTLAATLRLDLGFGTWDVLPRKSELLFVISSVSS